MDQLLLNLINEAIKLELNMAKLYGIFSEYNDDDRIFWNRLEVEEKNHAALLRTAKDFISFNRFPRNLIPDNLDALVQSNQKIARAIDSFIANPGRERAFTLAIDLEKSAGELHFQHFMEKEEGDHIMRIFQQLNMDDKDHAERINNYRKGITDR